MDRREPAAPRNTPPPPGRLACSVLAALLLLGSPTLAQTPPSGSSRQQQLQQLLLGDPSFKVRTQAAIMLGQLNFCPGGNGGSPSAAQEALLQALKDPHPAVRAPAALSLGMLASSPCWSLPSEAPRLRQVLSELRSDREPLVAGAARQALQLLDHPPAPSPAVPAGPSGPALPPDTPQPGTEELQVSGSGLASGRDPLEARRTLDSLLPALEGCALRQLKRDPAFAGVTLRLSIEPTGQLRLEELQPSLAAPLLVRCLELALGEVRLGPAGGGALRLTLPLKVIP